jgi:hypothetical protein
MSLKMTSSYCLGDTLWKAQVIAVSAIRQETGGEGKVPDITPSGKNVSGWSASDIAYYLESGFTPDFDTVGGTMVAVQENMSRLSADDRAAIAAYLNAVPAAHPTN